MTAQQRSSRTRLLLSNRRRLNHLIQEAGTNIPRVPAIASMGQSYMQILGWADEGRRVSRLFISQGSPGSLYIVISISSWLPVGWRGRATPAPGAVDAAGGVVTGSGVPGAGRPD